MGGCLQGLQDLGSAWSVLWNMVVEDDGALVCLLRTQFSEHGPRIGITNLLWELAEMQILMPQPRPTEPDTPGWGLCFSKPSSTWI